MLASCRKSSQHALPNSLAGTCNTTSIRTMTPPVRLGSECSTGMLWLRRQPVCTQLSPEITVTNLPFCRCRILPKGQLSCQPSIQTCLGPPVLSEQHESWEEASQNHQGSKICTQNGALVSGNMDTHLQSPWWCNVDPYPALKTGTLEVAQSRCSKIDS